MAKGYIGTGGIVMPDIWSVLPMLSHYSSLRKASLTSTGTWGLRGSCVLKTQCSAEKSPLRPRYRCGPCKTWWLVGWYSTHLYHRILHDSSLPRMNLTSGPREDVRGAFETVVALLGSAPFIAWCWKKCLEGNAGKFYYNVEEHSYAWLAFSMVFQLFCLETWFYWTHRISHMKQFYNFMHKAHHSYVPTISSCAAAFHPLDMAFLTFGCFIGPMLFPMFYPTTHFMLLIQMIDHRRSCSLPRWLLKAFGYGIISDPNLHNIHHDYGLKPANLGLCSAYGTTLVTFIWILR